MKPIPKNQSSTARTSPAQANESPFSTAKNGGPDRLPTLVIHPRDARKPGEEAQNRLNAALFEAAKEGRTRRLQELAGKGADVNARDELLWTPLMFAADAGHTETAEMLTILGARVNTKDNVWWTALMHASYKGHTKTAEMLISHRADVNATDTEGRTALWWASMNHVETAAMLMKYGARLG